MPRMVAAGGPVSDRRALNSGKTVGRFTMCAAATSSSGKSRVVQTRLGG